MSPLLVRLHPRVLRRRDWLAAALLRQAPKASWAFALCPDEHRFARALSARHTNYWLFRTHQQRSCADFVLVDMSSADPARRRTLVVELKLGQALSPGVGRQFAGAPAVLDLLAHRGLRSRDGPAERWQGAGEAVLSTL